MIESNDRLAFTDVVTSIVELASIVRQIPIGDPDFVVSLKQQFRRRVSEAVSSETTPREPNQHMTSAIGMIRKPL